LIHPYEWEFERNVSAVKKALEKLKIDFPVIFDKDRKIIKSLGINWWPTTILVKDSKIIFSYIGEGGYKILEDKITQILGIKAKRVFLREPEYSKIPCVYAGKKKGGKVFSLDNGQKKKFGAIYAGDSWRQKKEFIDGKKGVLNRICLVSKGRTAYMTAGFDKRNSGNRLAEVDVKSEGNTKGIKIGENGLYVLRKFKDEKKRIIEIKTKDKLRVYEFGFE